MSIKSLLSEEEARAILSMNLYWEEVAKRDDQSPLLNELINIINRLGIKTLWVLADYAKAQKAKEE